MSRLPTLYNLKYLVLTGLQLTGTLPSTWNVSSALQVMSLGGSNVSLRGYAVGRGHYGATTAVRGL